MAREKETGNEKGLRGIRRELASVKKDLKAVTKDLQVICELVKFNNK